MPTARRIQGPITLTIGISLVALGAWGAVVSRSAHAVVPLLIGCALVYLGWRGGRTATVVLGHALVVMGAYMITWGIYLLPHSEPIPAHVLGRPLFWGFITLLGGICAIYHGFCDCVMARVACRRRPDAS
jgi:hypothetical protein